MHITDIAIEWGEVMGNGVWGADYKKNSQCEAFSCGVQNLAENEQDCTNCASLENWITSHFSFIFTFQIH